MELKDLILILTNSLLKFSKNDIYLLKNNANERAITHKIACYIDTELKINLKSRWNVDAEYNRNMQGSKIIECEEIKKKVKTYPDIIIHKRGDNNIQPNDMNNILIIELKKQKKLDEDSLDYKKIKCFILSAPYHYLFGLYVNLNKNKDFFELDFFKRGDIYSNNFEKAVSLKLFYQDSKATLIRKNGYSTLFQLYDLTDAEIAIVEGRE